MTQGKGTGTLARLMPWKQWVRLPSLLLLLLLGCGPTRVEHSVRMDVTCFARFVQGDTLRLDCGDAQTWKEFWEKQQKERRGF